jgi:hypothetical protein
VHAYSIRAAAPRNTVWRITLARDLLKGVAGKIQPL